MRRVWGAAAIIAVGMARAGQASAAGWMVEENEVDPFDKNRATFVADTMSDGAALVMRCLEGEVSMLISVGASNAGAGDAAPLKIVADDKPVIDVDDAQVLTATNFNTGVQFGGAATLDYLDGAQKVSVRLGLAGMTTTYSFGGGRSLKDMIARTRKACGVTAPAAAAKAAGDPNAVAACDADFEKRRAAGKLAADPDKGAFREWCLAHPGEKD
jgi:hypothetical protein